MNIWLEVLRAARYQYDLQAVYDYIAQDNFDAALSLLLHIEDQVDRLADPNFPRRKGRKADTLELVTHPNYVVVFAQTATTVTVFNLLHVSRQYP
jgi:plasmid stabilization system protein ParE